MVYPLDTIHIILPPVAVLLDLFVVPYMPRLNPLYARFGFATTLVPSLLARS